MNIHIFDHQHELDQAAASLIIDTVRGTAQPVLGLATGSTPTGIYQALLHQFKSGAVSFKHATTFNLDEYVGLPPEHDQSYAYYMNTRFFDHIDIAREQVHLPDGMADDLEAECRQYDRMLAAAPVDLQLLGIGHNGHIGFNEPAQALRSGTHVVQLQEETLQANARFFERSADVPQRAITMGIGSILRAKSILLVVRGADKAAIVREALTGPITTSCPASLLQTHAAVTVLLDRAAGKELQDHDLSSPYLAYS
ncbi:glucosamine-6-phosphate deaminase [Paenibacillus sp. IB182496]|uniref:Glucosamine-6-phosphate deaminase n=1 Tax=Paenibacillus sabuli TaxID=2772509 RepID=A0A927GQM1_9BACL|nr:glucosamine-6-phosphate deaminase [Paenibacillus sabuli]MBD2844664.1 glucosamine-6-phosphate deaminase [Paenibacillus sabuli]